VDRQPASGLGWERAAMTEREYYEQFAGDVHEVTIQDGLDALAQLRDAMREMFTVVADVRDGGREMGVEWERQAQHGAGDGIR